MGEQERRFFHALCYAVGAEKALLQAVFRARIWRGKGFIPYPPKPRFYCVTNVFIPYALLRSYARFCQTSAKEKRCNPQKKITTLSKPYSILTDTSYLPSVSTSAISFAVALTIRMPVSLIPSRSASSCRRCVFFSGGVSKRNWSTDIL